MDIQFDQIQGLVLSGYGHLSHAGYLFLQVIDPAKARAWINERIPKVTNAVKPDKNALPPQCLNFAFTYSGLKALGVPKRALDSFSTEFKDGPAEKHRAHILGDVGVSDPSTWDYGGPQTDAFDVLVMLFANSEEERDAYKESYLAALAENGLRKVCEQNGYRTADSHEHFGFFDGISQPTIAGVKSLTTPADVQPGEFLLGYINEYGLQSQVPGRVALGSDVLGSNGTYLVYRKLAQNVKAFHDFLNAAAHGTVAKREYLGAKMVGRWPSGAPLVLSPDKDDPQLGEDTSRNNEFKFAEADPYGLACPVGSHIRRTNPRDSLEPNPTESLKTVKRHSILRRGRSYGALYDGTNPDHPRGLVFIALNADIRRQFEFMQEAWVNDPHFAGLYDNKDPIVGDRSLANPYTTMAIPRIPYREKVHDLPQFVTMRGGGYFFLPSLSALEYLVSLK